MQIAADAARVSGMRTLSHSTSVRVPEDVWRALKVRAVRERTTMTAVVEAACRAWLGPESVEVERLRAAAERVPERTGPEREAPTRERPARDLTYDRGESQERGWGRR